MRLSVPSACPRAWCLPPAALALALLAAPARADDAPAPTDVARLVADLGAAEPDVREAATLGLERLGTEAADALVEAADRHPDLEVRLRAERIVRGLPLSAAHDAPEAAALMDGYAAADRPTRDLAMHRLLRLDGDAGIEPLARLARLDATTAGPRLAAALLAREWAPADPTWEPLRPRITAGIAASARPAARFLRALVAFTAGDDAAARQAASTAAIEALAALEAEADRERAADGDATEPDGDDPPADDEQSRDDAALRILRRAVIAMLVGAGRRPEALEQAARLLPAGRAAAAPLGTADDVVWLAGHGLPEAADLLAEPGPDGGGGPLLSYAGAIAARARGADSRAQALADGAFAALAEAAGGAAARRRVALLLQAWGAADWAEREYRAVLDDVDADTDDVAVTAILFAEFLHDLGRDADAAAVLATLVNGRPGGRGPVGDEVLAQFDRSVRSVRSRMLFFESCVAATAGDAAARRRALEEALRQDATDVDALIACHALPDATPEQRGLARQRVAQALETLEEEIHASPDEANGYNEYAWLVANTEGDLAKATRYSRVSLELSFDSPSYLDTLAHCLAAAGDAAGAARVQAIAVRAEPHNRTLRRNLDRFRSNAAAP